MEWHAAVTGGEAATGQTTHTDSSGGQPTRACTSPRCEPCASSSELLEVAAGGEAKNRQADLHPVVAPNRQAATRHQGEGNE
jgi:hypothetical protein